MEMMASGSVHSLYVKESTRTLNPCSFSVSGQKLFNHFLFYVAPAKRFVITNATEMRCSSKVLRYSIILTTMVEHCVSL